MKLSIQLSAALLVVLLAGHAVCGRPLRFRQLVFQSLESCLEDTTIGLMLYQSFFLCVFREALSKRDFGRAMIVHLLVLSSAVCAGFLIMCGISKLN